MTANIGYGTTLAVSDASPAITPINVIPGVRNVTPPTASRDIVDSTSSDSPNFAREKIAGLIDYGSASAEIIYEPGSTADVLLRAMLVERSPRTWRITYTQFTPARTITFTGFLEGYEPDAPLDDLMTATLTINVTGDPVSA